MFSPFPPSLIKLILYIQTKLFIRFSVQLAGCGETKIACETERFSVTSNAKYDLKIFNPEASIFTGTL